MQHFTDANGKRWTVRVDYAAIKRARSLAGIDLARVVEDPKVLKALAEPIGLVDTIYAVCKPEADASGITDEAFGAAMIGEPIADATNALLESLADFFPEPRKGLMKGIIKRVIEVESKLQARTADLLQSPEMDAAIEAALGTSTSLSTGSPES